MAAATHSGIRASLDAATRECSSLHIQAGALQSAMSCLRAEKSLSPFLCDFTVLCDDSISLILHAKRPPELKLQQHSK